MKSTVPGICILLLLLPAACTALDTGDMNLSSELIGITVSTPVEGMDLWIDVVPPHAAVVGEIRASADIRSIRVESAAGEVSCGNDTSFACSVPVSAGANTIYIIAEDHKGNRAECMVNVTVHIGLPPPPEITVFGRVTATDGSPLSGAIVEFESGTGLSFNNSPLRLTTVTGDDGTYRAENLVGYRQKIAVRKDGYLPFQSECVFENQMSEQDFVLECEEPTVAGSVLATCGMVVPAGLALLLFRKKRS